MLCEHADSLWRVDSSLGDRLKRIEGQQSFRPFSKESLSKMRYSAVVALHRIVFFIRHPRLFSFFCVLQNRQNPKYPRFNCGSDMNKE